LFSDAVKNATKAVIHFYRSRLLLQAKQEKELAEKQSEANDALQVI
jgi:hypothetical protein